MSNPDKDFPNDTDRFTPLQDVPDLQEPEVMPDPVMNLHLRSQDITGFQAAPAHYSQKPRETIDLIRDAMTDEMFAGFCLGNSIKYRERAPSKGAEMADLRKAAWYEKMAAHLKGLAEDPRAHRPDFRPYERPRAVVQDSEFYGPDSFGGSDEGSHYMAQERVTAPTWSQQVEAESVAGPEEKPSSPPWPPLSQEQVVELHEALVGFRRTMESSKTIRDPDEQMSAIWDVATSLDGILVRLNIGTPQPPPRQEENLGGFACLDERRMGPPAPLGAYTGPPVEMVPIPAYSGAEPVDVPLTQKAVERTYPCRECGKPRTKAEGGTTFTVCDECWDKVHPMRTSITPTPEVKHNCWTCANNKPPHNNCPINGRLDVAMWVGSTHGWTMDGMPPKDCDGCPGWMPKS